MRPRAGIGGPFFAGLQLRQRASNPSSPAPEKEKAEAARWVGWRDGCTLNVFLQSSLQLISRPFSSELSTAQLSSPSCCSPARLLSGLPVSPDAKKEEQREAQGEKLLSSPWRKALKEAGGDSYAVDTQRLQKKLFQPRQLTTRRTPTQSNKTAPGFPLAGKDETRRPGLGLKSPPLWH